MRASTANSAVRAILPKTVRAVDENGLRKSELGNCEPTLLNQLASPDSAASLPSLFISEREKMERELTPADLIHLLFLNFDYGNRCD
jgi:hypothetical protein